MVDLKKILIQVKEKALKHYDELKSKTNDDEGKEMVIFASRTLHEGHVTDLRDEDTDEYIGITKDGWIVYTHDIEYFDGPIDIKNQNTTNINEDTLLKPVNHMQSMGYHILLPQYPPSY